jgi:hypothetical protein
MLIYVSDWPSFHFNTIIDKKKKENTKAGISLYTFNLSFEGYVYLKETHTWEKPADNYDVIYEN